MDVHGHPLTKAPLSRYWQHLQGICKTYDNYLQKPHVQCVMKNSIRTKRKCYTILVKRTQIRGLSFVNGLQTNRAKTNFTAKILFTDEANFYVNGEVNHQNLPYCSDSDPNWTSLSEMRGTGKVMAWCRIWGNRIVGPVFFDTNLTADLYLNMLQDNSAVCLKMESFHLIYNTPEHHLILISGYSDGWINSFQFMDWLPQPHGIACGAT